MAIQQLLVNGSFQELASIAGALGEYRRKWKFSNFQSTLRGLNMGFEEIAKFWHLIDLQSCDPNYLHDSKCDTKLSAGWGILLDSTKLPRNLLLYRLVELKFAGLLTVTIETIPTKGVVVFGRWEYAGPGERKVLCLRFPSSRTAVHEKR